MVRLLNEKAMPKVFWAEAARWSVHILNRSPTIAVKGKMPQEAWTGFKPNIDHFKVFGCTAHVHIPTEKRVKLDNKSFKCVFLGVSEESKAYRLFDPETKRVVTGRDVIFEENQSWNWGRNSEDKAKDILIWGEDVKDEVCQGSRVKPSSAGNEDESPGQSEQLQPNSQHDAALGNSTAEGETSGQIMDQRDQ